MTGDKINWGDFSFFAQGYEAIRVSILEYHQFPWWNPWMAGGIPLYANPQLGVFSIQTLLVFIFGAPFGLKMAVILYMILGYASMYLLLSRYFRVKQVTAILLSLVWILSSFFVAHMPSHFTFVWYMLAPLFVHLSLLVNNWKTGLLFGGAFAVMALSAVHNPFFQIGLVCAIIILFRFMFIALKRKDELKNFIVGLAAGAGLFVIIAGHRVFLAYQNVSSFDRGIVNDPPNSLWSTVLAILLPFSRDQYHSPHNPYPGAPFSWGEATSSMGAVATILAVALLAYFLFILIKKKPAKRYSLFKKQQWVILSLVFITLFFVALGSGNHGPDSPYFYLKHLPVFGEMRVSTRWLLWSTAALIVLIGVIATLIKNRKATLLINCVLGLGVLELFFLNFGYQYDILSKTPIEAPKATSEYSFTQIDEFGSLHKLSNGTVIPDDGVGPQFYREYEATTYNIGVVRANEPLINNRWIGVRPVEDKGVPFVLSKNASVTYWSPNKIILKRTKPGPITLNINESNYIKINGVRFDTDHVADTSKNLGIYVSDETQEITITMSPDYVSSE
ncbi:hypothetical protein PV379_03555 [Streptomyces caniscabiei]|nr:hypothetical protein [Streptomyces caniscabiei]